VIICGQRGQAATMKSSDLDLSNLRLKSEQAPENVQMAVVESQVTFRGLRCWQAISAALLVSIITATPSCSDLACRYLCPQAPAGERGGGGAPPASQPCARPATP